MLPSLWTPTAPSGGSLEVWFDVDGPPRSVLLHQPQHQQDVPAIQGEECLPDLIFLSSTFFQPIEFIQIQHEKRFKLVLKIILILITVYVGLFFVLAQIIEPGALFRRVYFLTGGVFDSVTKLFAKLILFSGGITALVMVTSEICAWVMRPASTISHPVCSPGFIVNHIPFFTLNISIVFGMVGRLVAGVFFEFFAAFWFPAAVVTSIFVTNQGARAHVASRLRQKIDTFTIGGNNTVHPVVSIALVPLRSLTGDAATLATPTRLAEDTVVFSTELQPLRVRALTRDALTLPTPSSATLCPVGE